MAEIKNGRRLIFIGGSPRSGTTLVQNMLDSHPHILGGPEFLHLPRIIGLRRKLHSSIAKGWIDIICTQKDVDNHIISFFEKLFLSLADKNGCELYSEKTPENIFVFSELVELFPEAHFIQVIRDPRAILSSMQQVKKRAISKGLKPPDFCVSLSASILYTKRCIDAGFKAVKNYPDKVLTLVFEHLLLNPEEESKKICQFLGIAWDNLMLSPGNKKHLGEQAITTKSNDIWYDSKTYNRNPYNRDIEKWKSELTLGQQLKTTMAFMGNRELTKCGYDFSLNSITQTNTFLLKGYYYFLCLSRTTFKYLSFVARNIPGVSMIRSGFMSAARFLK